VRKLNSRRFSVWLAIIACNFRKGSYNCGGVEIKIGLTQKSHGWTVSKKAYANTFEPNQIFG
jgi:hypothetical protein